MKNYKIYELIAYCGIAFALGCAIASIGRTNLYKNHKYESVSGAVFQTEEISQVDKAYASEMASAYSNVEKCDTNQKFIEKWDAFAKTYYNKTMEKADEELREKSIEAEKNWESYVNKRLVLEEAILLKRFASGSIVPVLLSDFECELHRVHAIDMQRRYFNLFPNEN